MITTPCITIRINGLEVMCVPLYQLIAVDPFHNPAGRFSGAHFNPEKIEHCSVSIETSGRKGTRVFEYTAADLTPPKWGGE